MTATTPPPATACPKELADGAEVYLAAKTYGQGLDATVRIRGASQLCFLVHGVLTNDCHLEGWFGPGRHDPTARVRCEMQLLGGCPIWQWKNDAHQDVRACLQREDDETGMSCDHFGSVAVRDDPATAPFEGEPQACGNQRDALGHPMAGFFCVSHGDGWTRACRPDGLGCSGWVRVVH